jgi:hypothetical protein
MTEGIQTDPNTVGPGQIRFFDSIQPPLEAGVYSLSASQQILDIPGESVLPYTADQQMLIDGPRFVLSPSLIHTVFPPANQNGLYDTILPNIVFNNFSLPWSRPIDPATSGGDTVTDSSQAPWMGLLTLYPSDLLDPGGNPKVTAPATMPVSELVLPKDALVLPPALGKLYGAEDQSVSVVDMDLAFFQSITPTLEELPFLAHARTVNTGGKVLLGMDDDGCFSLVIGNRLPLGNAKNTIYLVSYEGHQDHLRGSTITGNYTKIRLVLLGSWQFTADVSQGSFIKLMADLCEQGRGGVDLLQMPLHTGTAVLSPLAEEALKTGYVALQNSMREGETSTSWYHGPMVPSPTKRDFAYGPYQYSDHAIHYDPEYGLFNHAYSAAWQIGRLLALSDGSFSNALFNWRNSYLRTVIREAKKAGPEKLKIVSGVKGKDKLPANMLEATQLLFTGPVKQVNWPKIKLRVDHVLGEKLTGVLTKREKLAIIDNDEEPLLMIAKKIKGEKI